MKVILYTATTINGMLATKNNKTPWSDEEFKGFFNAVKKYGNVIVGRKTLPLFLDTDYIEMGDPVVVVLTRDRSQADKEKTKFVDSPKTALGFLEKEGFEVALVTGGGETNGAFLKENLIDEIFLDIEPMLFGDGIPVFSSSETQSKLEFVDSKMLNVNTIQLHYKVIK